MTNPGGKRSHVVTVAMTETEKEQLRTMAKEAGVSMGAFARSLLLGEKIRGTYPKPSPGAVVENVNRALNGETFWTVPPEAFTGEPIHSMKGKKLLEVGREDFGRTVLIDAVGEKGLPVKVSAFLWESVRKPWGAK